MNHEHAARLASGNEAVLHDRILELVAENEDLHKKVETLRAVHEEIADAGCKKPPCYEFHKSRLYWCAACLSRQVLIETKA